MKVICVNYLCIIDKIDGGLREYHKDSVYNVHSFGDFHVVNGCLLNSKQINRNFVTIYESRNRIINGIYE